MIGLWIISAWEILGKPKSINIVELGPGDGTLIKDLLIVFRKFPDFEKAKNLYLFEKSTLLKKEQKSKIDNSKVKWVNSFDKIKKGPVVFLVMSF